MVTEQEDTSMLLWRASGRALVTRETALVLAQLIFIDVYGEEDFRSQAPLRIADGGDRWLIEGSRRGGSVSGNPGQLVKGRTEIAILKANCQVVRLIQKAEIP